MNYKIINSKKIYSGKVFDIQVDNIIYNGTENKGIREIVIHPGGAVIAAETDDKKLLMVKQFRYPLEKVLWEFPAGKLDKNEPPETCAIRELREETGFIASEIKQLGKIATSPGFCSEILYLFYAKNLQQGKTEREEGELEMSVESFSYKEINQMILNNEIIDAKTICAFFLLKEKSNL